MHLSPPPKIEKFDFNWKTWIFLLYKKVLNTVSGTVTLSSGTATVTFTRPEVDTSYYITLGGDTAETFTWASKATTGFTINSSNGASTANVDWTIGR